MRGIVGMLLLMAALLKAALDFFDWGRSNGWW